MFQIQVPGSNPSSAPGNNNSYFSLYFVLFLLLSRLWRKRWKNLSKWWKRWFWPANSIRSTHLLVKIHNTLSYPVFYFFSWPHYPLDIPTHPSLQTISVNQGKNLGQHYITEIDTFKVALWVLMSSMLKHIYFHVLKWSSLRMTPILF